MTSKTNSRSGSAEDRILLEMMETAADLNRHGLLTKDDMAEMSALCAAPPVYTPRNVADIRIKKARMSQSVFASALNVTVSAVQKWESPASGKRPTGAAARLLQVIEKKGIEALFR
ncbi:helix-turn-helix domain-containing protein [Ramlibacter sp.]|uniref:helix-turn-helix domain-containing protein n=1 Tax=Ramlibacter sp. TaxID=1917967 RepID=UPI003D145463